MIICYFITLNEIITCGKIQIYTDKQSWDMDILILTVTVYCVLYVKIKIQKTTLKLLYMIDYMLFDYTKWDIN